MIGKRYAISPLLTDGALSSARSRMVDGAHDPSGLWGVVVELNIRAGVRPSDALRRFRESYTELGDVEDRPPEPITAVYVRCLLRQEEISRLLLIDWGSDLTPGARSIFRIWPDYVMTAHVDHSCATIKADAAGRTYAATGADVVWAVLDTGIQGNHPHFRTGNLDDSRVRHLHDDLTWLVRREQQPHLMERRASALIDESGHGTHVAGIIAGRSPQDGSAQVAELRPATGDKLVSDDEWPQWAMRALPAGRRLEGMAPATLLVSLKVLDGQSDPENPRTTSSAVMAAIASVREANAEGRMLQVHGVNMSLGCEWQPSDYAAGQSPLCRELNLLVATGVVVVVSAGNSGAAAGSEEGTGGDLDPHGVYASITEPAHADRVVTVGATHRDSPHAFGVWYRSAKGPTLDGRRKPDLVAPGEKITSAATGHLLDRVPKTLWQRHDPSTKAGSSEDAANQAPEPAPAEPGAFYAEESGTSMAAPHVSGAIAAFLSVRREFIGRPDEVKELFCSTAVDLKRDRAFQGHGLVDLMAALSNV